MSNIAILGHKTRGKEVIEILRMIGGLEVRSLRGNTKGDIYFVKGKYISHNRLCEISSSPYAIYTLEEFLEEFPYKVGDEVIINDCKDDVYTVSEMNWDGERIAYKIKDRDGNIDNSVWRENELLPYQEETMEEGQYKELRMPLDDNDKLATEATIDGNKILSPNGYLIGKITQVDNGMLVEYVKKQPEYPKTYEACCMVINNACMTHKGGHEGSLIQAFQKLLVCRDAYWKIAGEEMGLGKPWEPDWTVQSFKYTIHSKRGKIIKGIGIDRGTILTFPTEGMRDAFYVYFESSIRQCKELL